MKMFKSLLCIMLALVLTFSFSGCLHKQNEIAVEVNGVKYTAAMYSYALIIADSEATEKVNEVKKNEGIDPTITAVDYFKEKIDGVNYVTWVEKRAVEILTEYAAFELLFKEAGLVLDAAEKANIESSADNAFLNYGEMFTANGISKETYIKMETKAVYATKYFEYLYGKGGPKAISDEEMAKTFSENYKPVFMHFEDITNMEEKDLEVVKKDFEAIEKRIKKGVDLVKLYEELEEEAKKKEEAKKEETEEEHDHDHDHDHEEPKAEQETTSESVTTEETEKVAVTLKDIIQVFSNPEFDANYDQGIWDDVKDLKVKDTKIFEKEIQGTKYLILVYIPDDIASADFYSYAEGTEEDVSAQDNLAGSMRAALKSVEFEQYIEEYCKTLKVKKDEYAMSEFDVKEIKNE